MCGIILETGLQRNCLKTKIFAPQVLNFNEPPLFGMRGVNFLNGYRSNPTKLYRPVFGQLVAEPMTPGYWVLHGMDLVMFALARCSSIKQYDMILVGCLNKKSLSHFQINFNSVIQNKFINTVKLKLKNLSKTAHSKNCTNAR